MIDERLGANKMRAQGRPMAPRLRLLSSGLWPSALESHQICWPPAWPGRSRAHLSIYRRWGLSPRP